MKCGVQEILDIVSQEMKSINDEARRDALAKLLILPELHQRRWEYASGEEWYPCWLVARLPSSDLGIAYSQYGHGKLDPWGVVSMTDLYFGMDDHRFSKLDDAFINSGSWRGPIPDGYEIS